MAIENMLQDPNYRPPMAGSGAARHPACARDVRGQHHRTASYRPGGRAGVHRGAGADCPARRGRRHPDPDYRNRSGGIPPARRPGDQLRLCRHSDCRHQERRHHVRGVRCLPSRRPDPDGPRLLHPAGSEVHPRARVRRGGDDHRLHPVAGGASSTLRGAVPTPIPSASRQASGAPRTGRWPCS